MVWGEVVWGEVGVRGEVVRWGDVMVEERMRVGRKGGARAQEGGKRRRI